MRNQLKKEYHISTSFIFLKQPKIHGKLAEMPEMCQKQLLW